MKGKIGIVGFSFGLRAEEEEPGPSNEALAKAVVYADTSIVPLLVPRVVVTQWEITKALEGNFFSAKPDHSVELRSDGTYLDSKGVWEEAKAEFARQGVTQVIVIGQPFMHLPVLKKMVAKDYPILNYRVGKIPFDNSPRNTQPWTRTKLALLIYAIKLLLPGAKHGHAGQQNAK